MFSFFSRVNKGKVPPLKQSRIESDFHLLRDSQKLSKINGILSSLANKEDSESVLEYEQKLQEISDLLVYRMCLFLREISIGDFLYFTETYFEKINKEPNKEDAQTLFRFFVHQTSKDFQNVPLVDKKVPYASDKENRLLQIRLIENAYSSLVSSWKMLGIYEHHISTLHLKLIKIEPEFKHVFKDVDVTGVKIK